MGTSFDCPVYLTEQAATGKLYLGFGPFDMGDLKELLDWIGSEDGQDKIIAYTAKLVSHNQNGEHRPGCPCHYCARRRQL